MCVLCSAVFGSSNIVSVPKLPQSLLFESVQEENKPFQHKTDEQIISEEQKRTERALVMAQTPKFVGPRVNSPQDQPAPPKRLSIPSDAVAVAKADAEELAKIDPFALPFTRWIWVQSGEAEDFQAVSDAINKISRGLTIRRPVVKGIVARIDLRWYATSAQDISDWLSLWENFQFDGWFSLLITQDTLRLLSPEFKERTTVKIRKTRWEEKTPGKWVEVGTFLADTKISDLSKSTIVVRTNGEHLSKSGIDKLQLACNTIVPIVDSRYFLGRALSTIKDKDDGKDNLYSTIWGGLYYEFSGIRKAVTKDIKSDMDQLLFDLRALRQGETYRTLFDSLIGDERAVMFRSNITGKRRRVVWFAHQQARLSDTIPVVFITEDVRDRDVDIGTDPIMNLVDFRTAAYEVIFTKANGEQGYALYDAVGKLLDEAAPDVASDDRIPSPHPKRLQSGISCIRCHGPSDGWIPFVNDGKTLLSKKGMGLDVFGDISKRELNKEVSETVGRIAGWYSGDPTILMQRLRDDYSKAVIKSTGRWKEDDGQLNTVKVSSARISKIWNQDRYDQIDAKLALRYLGFPPVGEGEEVQALSKILPPIPLNVGGIIPEDPRAAALKEGLKINPVDFTFTYSFLLSRSILVKEKDVKKQ
jgi:hypothetical protein